jgi:His-Xaa-Ser system protein HxsD
MSPKKQGRTAVRTSAKKKAPARRPAAKAKGSGLSFTLDVKKLGLETALGAAYLMMDRAWVSLEGDKTKSLTVTLRPKPGSDAAAVKAAFEAELESQKLRWAVARNNRSVREYVAENAVSLAQQKPAQPAAEPAAEQLTDAQRSEIERLIAEVETEIKEMNAKKAVADPKGVAPSWEAQQEARKGGTAP